MGVGEHGIQGTAQQKLHGDPGSVADRFQEPVLYAAAGKPLATCRPFICRVDGRPRTCMTLILTQ
jgi:hypothetical protein